MCAESARQRCKLLEAPFHSQWTRPSAYTRTDTVLYLPMAGPVCFSIQRDKECWASEPSLTKQLRHLSFQKLGSAFGKDKRARSITACLSDDLGFVVRCLDQFFGYDTSSCAHPCQTFQTRTKYLSGVKTLSSVGMGVKMKFSPKVPSDPL